jgi:hypothetical protein
VDDALANAFEVFSAPIEGVILALGKGVSQAQAELDRNSVAAQQTIDADPVLSQYGIQATWYQMPRVDLQLRLALTVAEEQQTATQTVPSARLATLASGALRLIAQPVSAAFQNHFNYTADASSLITLSIVPVPSPGAGNAVTVPPRMTAPEALKAALASPADFVTVVDSAGDTVPAPTLRHAVNFNAAARTWYVLQHDPTVPAARATVAAVDDATGAVRVLSS